MSSLNQQSIFGDTALEMRKLAWILFKLKIVVLTCLGLGFQCIFPTCWTPSTNY